MTVAYYSELLSNSNNSINYLHLLEGQPIQPKTKKTMNYPLKNLTWKANKILFPPIPPGYNVQFRAIQIYGLEGSGKTSMYRALSNVAAQRYGKRNVNAVVSISLKECINAINKKPVQILFVDDAGVQNQTAPEDLIAQKSIIRRSLESKRDNGIILLFFAVQSYFMLDSKLRDTLFVEFLKNAPTSPYHIAKLTRLFGESAIGHLKACQTEWIEYNNYNALSYPVVRVMDEVGYYEYQYTLESILRELTTSYNMDAKKQEKKAKIEEYRQWLSKKRWSRKRDKRRQQHVKAAIYGFELGLTKSQVKALLGVSDPKINEAHLIFESQTKRE